LTLRKRPRAGTGSPKVLFGENKAPVRSLISSAVRGVLYSAGAGPAPGPLVLTNSLLFNPTVNPASSSSSELNRTPTVAGNQKVWTYSAWIKPSSLAATTGLQSIFSAGSNNTYRTNIWFAQATAPVPAESIRIYSRNASGVQLDVYTNVSYQSTTDWFHLVVSVDIAASKCDIYVNGVLQSTTVNTFNNVDTYVNATDRQAIGKGVSVSTQPFSGYQSDVYLLDGTAADPTDFGQEINGIWYPKAFTGTYGTNGFHLDFADNSTANALGTDVSGNGNDFTAVNVATEDQVLDTPSLNYATWNYNDIVSGLVLTDGALKVRQTVTAYRTAKGTQGVSTGKRYFEATLENSGITILGIASVAASKVGYVGQDAYGWGYASHTGGIINNSSVLSTNSTFTTGDVIGIALDADANTVSFYKNNVLQYTATGLPNYTFFPANSLYTTTSNVLSNFGQRPFVYTPPAGYLPWNMAIEPFAYTIKLYAKDGDYLVSAQTTNANSLSFNNDGSELFVVNQSTRVAYKYNLSSAYDINTASYSGVSATLPPNPYSAIAPIYDHVWHPDGTSIIFSYGTTGIVRFLVGTPWDITTVTSFLDAYTGYFFKNPISMAFSPDGSTFTVVLAGSGYRLQQYNLSSPWDLSTAGFVSLYNFNGQQSAVRPQGIVFSPDGTKIIITSEILNFAMEFNLSTPFDITTSVLLRVNGNVDLYNMVFTPDGKKVVGINGTNRSEVISYQL